MDEQTPEAPPVEAAAAKQKRKAARRKARPAPDVLAGLTVKACADGCYAAGRCVITGGYCAHPYKGGLQSRELSNRATVKRFTEAKRRLLHASVDKRAG